MLRYKTTHNTYFILKNKKDLRRFNFSSVIIPDFIFFHILPIFEKCLVGHHLHFYYKSVSLLHAFFYFVLESPGGNIDMYLKAKLFRSLSLFANIETERTTMRLLTFKAAMYMYTRNNLFRWLSEKENIGIKNSLSLE